MIREVVLKTVEAINCKYHGLITMSMCRKCPYFGGYVRFKQIRCKRKA